MSRCATGKRVKPRDQKIKTKDNWTIKGRRNRFKRETKASRFVKQRYRMWQVWSPEQVFPILVGKCLLTNPQMDWLKQNATWVKQIYKRLMSCEHLNCRRLYSQWTMIGRINVRKNGSGVWPHNTSLYTNPPAARRISIPSHRATPCALPLYYSGRATLLN